MKLLIVTAIKECRKDVAEIFAKNGINAYSVTNIHGVRNKEANDMADNWFGSDWDEEYESAMLFSFTDDAVAGKTLSAIELFNKNKNNRFPVKAIVVPAEKAVGFF